MYSSSLLALQSESESLLVEGVATVPVEEKESLQRWRGIPLRRIGLGDGVDAIGRPDLLRFVPES